MIYILDTDILILMMRGLKTKVAKTETQKQRVAQAKSILAACRSHTADGHTIGCSAITLAELEFGSQKGGQYEQEVMITRQALSAFQHFDWTVWGCVEAYGRIRHHLESKGKCIGENDQLIAAHALALEAVLVTNNTREFTRIPGLKVENWSRASG